MLILYLLTTLYMIIFFSVEKIKKDKKFVSHILFYLQVFSDKIFIYLMKGDFIIE